MAYAVNRRRQLVDPLVNPLGAPLTDPAALVRPPSDLPPPVGPVNTTQPVAYPGGSPGPTPSVTAPPPATTTPALSPTRGGTGASNYRYGGYDFNQDPANRDVSSSAKYLLADLTRIAAERGVPMPQTKPEAEAFALQYLVPGFEAEGYNIRNVQGDSFTIDTRENDNEVIDWLVNAGSTNPDEINIGWQSDVGDVNAGSGQGLNAAVQSLMGMPGGSDIFSALMSGDGLGSSDLMRRIQAELQKLLTGQSPSAPNAPLPGGNVADPAEFPF